MKDHQNKIAIFESKKIRRIFSAITVDNLSTFEI